jgi:hypothetical protein
MQGGNLSSWFSDRSSHCSAASRPSLRSGHPGMVRGGGAAATDIWMRAAMLGLQ